MMRFIVHKQVFLFFGHLLTSLVSHQSIALGLQDCECGIENTYIYSFDEDPESPIIYPWMGALVENRKDPFCGGTLVSDRHILTAAHCLHGKNPQNVTVTLGVHDLAKTQEKNRHQVSQIFIYPGFKSINNGATFENDVAIALLTKPIKFTSNLLPVCLPPSEMVKFERSFNTIGWGQLTPNSTDKAQRLQEIYLQEISGEKCAEAWNLPLGKDYLCVGKEMENVCKGDDGGPLMYNVDSYWYQVGITSFSGPVCGDQYPGVFARLTSYLNWIQTHLKSAEMCKRVVVSSGSPTTVDPIQTISPE